MVLDPGQPLPPLRYGHGKVLVVDDSSAIRLLLGAVLSAEHQVLVASNGRDALDLAVRERPDVILLDLVMAGMDGYAVCARLKSDPRTEDIPVLFLTSRSSEEEETLWAWPVPIPSREARPWTCCCAPMSGSIGRSRMGGTGSADR